MEKIVTKTDAKYVFPTRIKTCAYARVSSGKDAMLQSLNSQVSYYSKMIQNEPRYLYVGVYIDEAISGTKDRPEFQRMLNDAKAGKFSLIITKSISRFARNTLTLLKAVRELKEAGVDVYFEEQGIHSISSEGELLLTIMGSFYQEEARNVSENCKWRIRRDFEEGKLYGSADHYGYKLVKRDLIVVPEQAEVVKRIFDLYLEGCGFIKIANILNKEGVPTLRNAKWTRNTIAQILINVNYTGDLLLQKTYSDSYLTKLTKNNHGQLQKYYVEGHHEPIISKEIYDEVQMIRLARAAIWNSGKKEDKEYPFVGILKCANCGKPYKHKKNSAREYYVCGNFTTYGRVACTNSGQIPTSELIRLTKEVLNVDEVTSEILEERLDCILSKESNILTYVFKTGEEIDVIWNKPSRKDSWTPEMRKQAGLHSLKKWRERK